MPRSEVTCGCGAKLIADSRWTYDVMAQVQAFHDAHAECRKQPNEEHRPTPRTDDGN